MSGCTDGPGGTVSATITAPPTREEPEAPPPRRAALPVPAVRPMTAWFFLFLVGYQTFHQAEHTIETVQLQLLHHGTAHTLINGIDFEYVHFGANTLLLYGLIAVVIGAGAQARARLRAEHPWGFRAMVAALGVQGYHVFDHTVRLFEYLQSGGKDPGGTLTVWVNPVWFHFAINLTVLVGMIVAFFGLRIHEALIPTPEVKPWASSQDRPSAPSPG